MVVDTGLEPVTSCVSSRQRGISPDMLTLNLESAVERGAIAQLIGSPALAQKPQLTHRVSPRFCTNAFDPSSCTLHPRSTAESRLKYVSIT